MTVADQNLAAQRFDLGLEHRQAVGEIGPGLDCRQDHRQRRPAGWAGWWGGQRSALLTEDGESHQEFTPPAEAVAPRLDGAVVQVHKALDERETDAQPAA